LAISKKEVVKEKMEVMSFQRAMCKRDGKFVQSSMFNNSMVQAFVSSVGEAERVPSRKFILSISVGTLRLLALGA